jgi:intein/homing endonuclease
MEWHVWDFPENIRIYLADEFRLKLFNKLKEICGSRYRLAKILKLHPMTVKEYELAKSSEGRDVFLSVSVLKKIIDILKKYECSSLIAEIERHIEKIRMSGKGLIVNHPRLPIEESKELYSFVAHMIGDGCASRGNVPYYCSTNRELINSFKKDLQVFGEFEPVEYIRKDKRGHETIYLRFPTVISNIVQHMLKVKFTKPDKLPDCIFRAPEECKVAFVRAFFDDEGSVTCGRIYFTQKSRNILEQLKLLLKSLNIETSKIYHKKKTNTHQFIILASSYEKFYSLIKPHHNKKFKLLKELIEKRRSKPVPIKHKVLNLLQKEYPLTADVIASKLNLNLKSVIEALCSLHEEGKIARQFISSRKPRLWYPKV